MFLCFGLHPSLGSLKSLNKPYILKKILCFVGRIFLCPQVKQGETPILLVLVDGATPVLPTGGGKKLNGDGLGHRPSPCS